MRLSSTTDRLQEKFGIYKAIDILSEAGYDAIDFSQFDKEIYESLDDKAYYTEIRKYAEDKGLCFNQSHAPFASSFEDEERTAKRFDEIVNAIKRASYLGIKNIIVHPCQHLKYDVEGNPEKLFEYNMEFYSRLIPYCEEYGIRVALENMWQYTGMVNHSTCSRPDEFVRYLDGLNNDCFVACLDLGHAALVRENIGDFIKKLGNKRLQCLHVHDVDGTNDSHTLPFYGSINWDKVMRALAQIDYKGDLTFEADAFMNNKPDALLPDYAILMAKTGKYLVSVFDGYKK
ncbi:MAG: sugar phosphate isomerase/epimerase [Clostridia bacterium]|nr:sugar phosphate isomerase/epimerase [Clostridia bacterium]